MIFNLKSVWFIALIAPFAGCSGESLEFGSTEQAAMIPNTMIPNAMIPNAMIPNAMIPNAMIPNALSADALDEHNAAAIADSGEAGVLSREFLRYAVSCAFSSSQSFDFSWTDANGGEHQESYPGAMGLAPGWKTGPLDQAGQEWVTACLASRVNAKGVSVMLSLRGTSAALATTSAERAAFPVREGVFFGNVFTSEPAIYACYDPLNILAKDFTDRVCSGSLLGHQDCGAITVVGPCFGLSLLGIPLLSLGKCPQQGGPGAYLYGCRPGYGQAPMASITSYLDGLL